MSKENLPRLLVVEDEDLIGHSLRTFFEKDGFHVDLARTSDQAFQMIGNTNYEAVIADIYLHRAPTGLDILERVRTTSPETAVIIITGRESVETVIQAWRSGALDYFRKPVNLMDLRKRLLESLESRRLSQEISIEAIQERFDLTQREVVILRHVLRGLTNSAIAAVLYIEEGTVKNHLTRIFKKCGVENRKELFVKLRNISREE